MGSIRKWYSCIISRSKGAPLMNTWKKDIWNIPNLLSLFRIVLIPVYVIIYLRASEPGQYFIAGAILAVSCITDMVDGAIARRFHMVTTIGKLLDPLADKLTQLALILCLSRRYPVLLPVLYLLLVKESFQLTALLIHYRRGKALDGALMAGKVSTTVLFITLTLLVLLPDCKQSLVSAIALLDGGILIYTFIQYVFAYFGKHAQVRDLGT